MVFNPDKYRDEIVRMINENEGDHEGLQNALNDWIEHSPITGKPVSFNTYVPRKSTLKHYMKREFGIDFKTNKEDLDKYKELRNDEFERKEQPKLNLTKIEAYMYTMKERFSRLDDWVDYPLTKNQVNHICLYLMLTCGRRVSEFYKYYQGLDPENPDLLVFKLSKKKQEEIVSITPLIEAKDWDYGYSMVSPYLQLIRLDSMNSRLNKFIKTINGFENFTLHSLRKVYAELYTRFIDKSDTRKVVKIKQALNHTLIETSERYNIKTKRTKYCDICDKDVSQSNYKRHIKTKKHLKKQQKQQAQQVE